MFLVLTWLTTASARGLSALIWPPQHQSTHVYKHTQCTEEPDWPWPSGLSGLGAIFPVTSDGVKVGSVSTGAHGYGLRDRQKARNRVQDAWSLQAAEAWPGARVRLLRGRPRAGELSMGCGLPHGHSPLPSVQSCPGSGRSYAGVRSSPPGVP